MDGAVAASSLGVLLQILFLDLLLSGDNALVIALACRKLPEDQARRAAWLGAAGAVGLRLVLTTMAGAMMTLPALQWLSALPLLVIALNLMADEDHDAAALGEGDRGQSSMLAAAGVIVVSDAAMSLDNVVALAAVSGGRFWLLAFGVACSIPLIVFGSLGFSRLLRAYPWLADLGAAMLGWVAGGMIVGDPLIAGWVRTQAMALDFVMPLACAIFVLIQGRFARERAMREPKPAAQRRPAQPPAPKPVKAPPPAPPVLPAQPVTPSTAPAEEKPPTGQEAAPSDPTDRWMAIGLAALFLIFGVFLTVVLMIPD